MEVALTRQVEKVIQSCGSDVDSDDFMSDADDDFGTFCKANCKTRGRGGRSFGTSTVRVREVVNKRPRRGEVSKGWRALDGVTARRRCPHGRGHTEACVPCDKESVKLQEALFAKQEEKEERDSRIKKRVEAHRRQAVIPEIHICRICNEPLSTGICSTCNLVKRPNKSWRCGTCNSQVSARGLCLNSDLALFAAVSALPLVFPSDVLRFIFSFSVGDLGPPDPCQPLAAAIESKLSYAPPYHHDVYNARRTKFAARRR